MERKKQEVIVIAFVAVMTAFAAMPITAMSEYASPEHKAPLNVTTPTAAEEVITSMTIVQELETQELETITFPAGTYVIPMDDKQNDIIRAFGFLTNVLQNATIYRIIEPPDITIKTSSYPAGTTYSGGPVLVMPEDSAAIASAQAVFPSVTVDTLNESFTSNRVFRVEEPTNILIIYGEWAHTQDVLDDMGIPYTMVNRSDVEANPSMLLNYDLVVVDCPGWAGFPPAEVQDKIRELVNRGGEVIFTDIALLDLAVTFPGYTTVVPNVDGVWNCTTHNPPVGLTEGEFPSQYDGPANVMIYTMGGGYVFSAVSPGVRVVLDCQNYAGDYRILAAYFNYGRGIVEGFAYHPHEQVEVGPPGPGTGDPNSYNVSCIFYGNKFVHATKPKPTPTPTAVPAITPNGLIALIGLLSAIAVATISIRKKR